MGIDDRLPSQDCRAFRLGNLSIANIRSCIQFTKDEHFFFNFFVLLTAKKKKLKGNWFPLRNYTYLQPLNVAEYQTKAKSLTRNTELKIDQK